MDIEDLAKNYKPDQSGIDVVRNSRIVFVVGIVSAGKDTIQNILFDSPDYYRVVNYTTRLPRENDGVLERDGDAYHFVSIDGMSQLLASKEMLEINQFGGNYYGTGVKEFANANSENKIALVDVEINGVAFFNKVAPDSVTAIFIVPPDYKTWIQRFSKRYNSEADFKNALAARRGHAIDELETALAKDYYCFVVNDDISATARLVDNIARHADGDNGYDDSTARRCAEKLLEDIKRPV